MAWPDRYREQAVVWRAMGGEKEAECYEQLAREWDQRDRERKAEDSNPNRESDPTG